MTATPRVAIVHDYLTQRGGAERVVLALLRAFPGARLVTSLYAPETTFDEFRDVEIETLPLNRVAAFRTDARRALPLLAPAFSRHTVADADVLVCSSSGWAHGIGGPQPRLVYCYNTPRWLHQRGAYLAGQGVLAKVALPPLAPALRRWSQRAAHRAHTYCGISRAVVARIRAAYGLDAVLLPPPVTLCADGYRKQTAGLAPGFLLCVSRGRGYKNVHVVVDAVQRLLPDQRLVVLGDLPPGTVPDARIRELSPVSDAELRWLYASCSAVVSAAYEDFGLTPLEGNLFGKPAVVLRAGGFLDTLVEGVTGVFIEAPTSQAIAAAVHRLPKVRPDQLRAHARRFDEAAFARSIRSLVTTVASAEPSSPTIERDHTAPTHDR